MGNQGTDVRHSDSRELARIAYEAPRRPKAKPTRLLGGPLLATWTVAALAVLVPMALTWSLPDPVQPTWVGAWMIAAGAACRFAWLVGAGERRLIETNFWLFVYLFLGIAPLVQLWLGVSPGTTPGLEPTMNGTALWIVAVGCIAFIVGGAISRHRAGSTPAAVLAVRTLSGPRLTLLSLGALAASGYFVNKVGLGALFSSRDGLVAASSAVWPDATTRALMTAGASMPLLVALVALVKLREQRSREGRDRSFFMAFLVVVALAVTVNPISSPRYVFGTMVLSVLSVLGMYASPGRYRAVAIASVAAFILIFPLADAYRHTSTATINSNGPVDALTTGDFDAFGQINNTALFVERQGATNGRQALGVALFWVPRSVWPDKPTDTGILLAQSRGYWFTNLSAPLWAELFINGGWAVLLLGMVLFGYCTWRLDSRIAATMNQARAPGVLACILPAYLILVLRGSLLQSMAYLSVIVACAVFVTRRRARQAVGS